MKFLKAFAITAFFLPVTIFACSFDTDCAPGSKCAKASGSIYGVCLGNAILLKLGYSAPKHGQTEPLVVADKSYDFSVYRQQGYSDDEIFSALVKKQPELKVYTDQGYTPTQILGALEQKKQVGHPEKTMQIVELPDGTRAKFPDNTPVSVMENALRRDFPQFSPKQGGIISNVASQVTGGALTPGFEYVDEHAPIEQQAGSALLSQPDNSHPLSWGIGVAVFVAVALLAWFKFKKTATATRVGAAAQSPIHAQNEKCYAENEPHDLPMSTTKGNAMSQNQKRILMAVLAIVAAMFVYVYV